MATTHGRVTIEPTVGTGVLVGIHGVDQTYMHLTILGGGVSLHGTIHGIRGVEVMVIVTTTVEVMVEVTMEITTTAHHPGAITTLCIITQRTTITMVPALSEVAALLVEAITDVDSFSLKILETDLQDQEPPVAETQEMNLVQQLVIATVVAPM